MTSKLNEMSISERLRISNELGEKVAKMLNSATRKANKLLKEFGFEVTVEAQFRELDTSKIDKIK